MRSNQGIMHIPICVDGPPGVVQCTVHASVPHSSGFLFWPHTPGLDKAISLILIETVCFLHFQMSYQVPLKNILKCRKNMFMC